MSGDSDPGISARRVRTDEWQLVRSLRLASTADPDAPIAFLENHDEVAARTDDFWRTRTADAAQSETVAQFVAVIEEDAVGSLSVIIRATGQKDHFGTYIDDRRADVVGVWVRPDRRGTGAIDALLAAAAEFVAAVGLRRMQLDVHRDNQRAQAAYRRSGFEPTGEAFTGPIGPEIVMARNLP
jgi:ribosomal protein S18 acetylase RimI-like enzyme